MIRSPLNSKTIVPHLFACRLRPRDPLLFFEISGLGDLQRDWGCLLPYLALLVGQGPFSLGLHHLVLLTGAFRSFFVLACVGV